MQTYLIRHIGSNRNAPRLWLEGRAPENAGFNARQRYEVALDVAEKRITLRLDPQGTRVVSQKEKNGRAIPIIDINSRELLGVFEGMEQVRVVLSDGAIHILPLASEARAAERLSRLKDKLATGQPLSMGSLSHGGGVLSLAVHEGLADAGVETQLSFANDIREDLLEHAAQNNPAWTKDTRMIAAPMQEFAFDSWATAQVPPIDVLEAGIPCEGASLSGRAKNATVCAEAHEEVGHLVVAFLAEVARFNPSVVLLENVPPYQHSSSMWILRHQLRDLGYDVHEMVLDGADWNLLEHRTRLCMVATTKGLSFDASTVERPEPALPRLGDVLEDIGAGDPRWSPMQYLKDKAERDLEAGKGFKMQIVGPDSTKIGTIGKGYQKNRSTEPKVQHPTDPELLRMLTPKEHAHVKGVDVRLIEGLCLTTAHQLLGQGIVPAPFRAVGKAIGRALKALTLRTVAAQCPGLQEAFAL